MWESVEHFKQAFTNPEFQAKLQDYPPSAAASPHLVNKVAVPGTAWTELGSERRGEGGSTFADAQHYPTSLDYDFE